MMRLKGPQFTTSPSIFSHLRDGIRLLDPFDDSYPDEAIAELSEFETTDPVLDVTNPESSVLFPYERSLSCFSITLCGSLSANSMISTIFLNSVYNNILFAIYYYANLKR